MRLETIAHKDLVLNTKKEKVKFSEAQIHTAELSA